MVLAVNNLVGFGAAASASAVSSLSFLDSAVTETGTITVPATVQTGDLLFLFEYDRSFTIGAHSGWSADIGSGTRATVFTKIAEAGDASSSITVESGSSDPGAVILAFRPVGTISTITPASTNTEITGGNPAAQSVTAGGGTEPLVVVGMIAGTNPSSAFNASTSPAFDAEVDTATPNVTVGYKIYNSSPQNHTVDADDTGVDNALSSGYFEVA